MIKMLQPSFARIGYIKIGDKGGKSGSPRKFDHFEIRSTEKTADGDLVPDDAMMARLGERPTSLKIRLPFNDIDMVFNSTLAYYRGRNRFCWGDGETAQRLTITQNGEHPRFGPAAPFGPCGETCPDFVARRCKPLASLQVILEEQQQIGGAYLFKTTSWNSIRNIMTALTAIKAQAGGLLAWVPLTMKLVPQVVQPKDGGTANTAYIVQIVFEGSPQQLLTTVRELLGTRAPLIQELRELEAGLKALPPAEEEAGEASDTQEEFYPEMRDAGPPAIESPTLGVPLPSPTREEVDAILASLVTVYVDRDRVREYLREVMQISPDRENIGQKWLYKNMTRAHYEELKAAVAAKIVEESPKDTDNDEEDDVPIFSGPDPAQPRQNDANVSGEGSSGSESTAVNSESTSVVGDRDAQESPIDHTPAGEVYEATAGFSATDLHEPPVEHATPAPGKYATPEQIAGLKELAQQVGDAAYADLQDRIEHHGGTLTQRVYAGIREKLITREAEQKHATEG
jgi:hypothetical protein